jgi:glucokinase
MLLAGDVGGTKTLLGLFERGDPRPRQVEVRSYPTADFPSFTAILDAFTADLQQSVTVDAVVAGVAGPVIGGKARITNIGWDVTTAELSDKFGTPRARLLNDLETTGLCVEVLRDDELAVLQAGTPRDDGNAVVIAAGTGLGEAFLHRVDGRVRSLATEAGHADFAARTEREVELLRMLLRRHGRAAVESVLSGPGLLNLHRFTHGDTGCTAGVDLDDPDAPTHVSQAGLDGVCPACVEALSLFVGAYGAEAGNLALRGVATAGVYVGGGIAPKILPALRDGRFVDAFNAKGKMAALAAACPVKVILNPEAALLGAAVHAGELAERDSR